MTKYVLPIRPLSVNTAWRGGPRYRTNQYKQYERDIGNLLLGKKTVKGDIKIDIEFHFKDRYTIRDVDAPIKPLLDCLVQNGLIDDDRHVIEIRARKIKSEEEKMVIKITPVK